MKGSYLYFRISSCICHFLFDPQIVPPSKADRAQNAERVVQERLAWSQWCACDTSVQI